MSLRVSQISSRIFSLLTYHKPKQFLHRLKTRIATPTKHVFYSRFLRLEKTTQLEIRDTLPRISDFPNARLPLLNRVSKFPNLMDKIEQFNSFSDLERFEFHSHQFLLADNDPQKAWTKIINWATEFPFEAKQSFRESWHPYVCSKRIQNWLALWISNPPPAETRNKILKLLHHQLTWLEASIEKDIEGNHLWENAQALVIGGTFFKGTIPDRWLNLGINQLRTCINTQINNAGEHQEKSPSYQWELIQGLRFLVPWLQLSIPKEINFFVAQAEKMESFLSEIAHPSGLLPFFNDSWETKSSVNSTFYRKWVGDYFVCRSSDLFFIFDAGDLGADFLPAHSHCDLLTFEASFDESPLILNSGTFAYQGPKRNVYRGSKAHNVLVLNQENSADIWSSFRMGRRGHVLERKSTTDQSGTWILASHDGYKHLGFPKMTRIWFISNPFHFLCSFHITSPRVNEGVFQEFIHLHPSLKSKLNLITPAHSSQKSLELKTPRRPLFLHPLGQSSELTIENSFFSPSFGLEIPNETVKFSFSLDSMTDRTILLTAWCLGVNQNRPELTLDFENKEIELKWIHENRTFQSKLSL